MAAQDYTSVVQQLYVSYFGRPADYYGLQNFSAALNAMGAPKTFAEVNAAVQADKAGTTALSKLVNSFNTSTESTNLYGTDNSQIGISKFVNAIYQNVLGRDADKSGFDFWVNAITSGTLTKANAAASITQAALTNTSDQGKLDALTVQNKLAVAKSFTDNLDTPAEITAFSGEAAAAAARSLLSGVNSGTNMTAIQTTVANSIVDIVSIANPGKSFDLSESVDTLVGTTGNDTFNATAASLSTLDKVDGAGGKDTLIVQDAEAKLNVALPSGISITNVEKLVVNTSGALGGAAAAAFDVSGVASLTDFTATAVGGANVKIADITNLTATNAGTGAVTVAGGKNVAVSTGTGDVTVTGAGLTTVSVKGGGLVNIDNQDAKAAVGKGASLTAVSLDGIAGGANVHGASLTSVALSNLTAAQTIAVDNATASHTLNLSANAVGSNGTTPVTVTVADAIATTVAITASGKSNLTLNAAKATKVTVNAADATTLDLTAAAAKLATIDASASAGAVTLTGIGADVTSVTTGAGNDKLTVSTATLAATTTAAAKNATVSTGAGNDDITVSTTGTGLTSVDAGAGNDKITITKVVDAGLNIIAGEGNDTVAIGGAALATTDVIDGGAGTDAISVAGAATRSIDDFIVFNKLVKNFETIKFTTAEGAALTALDASLLGANYTTIDLASGSFVTNVGTQSIVANGALNVSASGYAAAEAATATTAAKAAVYAGTLNITEKATGTVTANADVVKLTVAAGTAALTGTLAGDAKSAIVTVNNSANSDNTADILAKFVLNTGNSDAAMTSVTVSGSGSADITNAAGTSLVNVDASGLGGKLVSGDATTGLTYVSTNAAVETVKLGAGIDHITLNASTYGKVDTVTGLNLVVDTATKTLAASSDTLVIAGATGAVKFTTTQTDLDLALKDAAAYSVEGVAKETVVFTLGGDTYVYHDAGTLGSVDAADVLVKLTGTVDLNALVLALG